jgi:hypothetical protein
MTNISPNSVRRAVIAGSWYPGDPQELGATIDKFLAQSKEATISGEILGLIVPHAGYIYSGAVAAQAYKQVQDKDYERVVVISPMHRMHAGPVAITQNAYYETPLGKMAIDLELVEALQERVNLSFVARDNEHALEIQLPFIQRLLPETKLLPIMMGTQDKGSCQSLANVLADIVQDRDALFVASTDLSHFHTQRQARSLDQHFLDDIEAYDIEQLAADLAQGKTEACGGGPVLTVMQACAKLGADHAKILEYATSADTTGDTSNVVGYAAGVIYQAQA